MAPFIAAALPAIIGAVPALGRLFSSGSATAERNIKAAEVVVNIAQEALGARNAQEVAERVQADPAAAQAVQEAVRDRWFEISPDLGGVAQARQADASAAAAGSKPGPALWITLALLPLVYAVVFAVLFRPGFSDEVRAMVVASIVSGLLGGISGYWLGTSWSSSKKTELLGSR